MSDTREPSDSSVHSRALDRVSDGILALDSEFRFTYLNDSAEQLLDSTASDLLGKPIWDAFPEATDSVAEQRIRAAAETQKTASYERYNESVDRWFDVRVCPDEDGLSLIFNDITERKQRENELERYERIVENLPVAVGQSEPDEDGTLVYVNDETVEMFGAASKTEIKGYAIQDFYVDAAERGEVGRELAEHGRVEDYEIEFETVDGDRFWGSLTATTETLDDETQVIGIIQEISERRQYEQVLDQLHDATREMLSATTPEEVATVMTETADNTIGLATNGVHLYDDAVEGLVPVSVSEESKTLLGEPPTLDEGIAWEAFQQGELRRSGDLQNAETYNESTLFGSELVMPLGEYGVFIASATESDAFGQRDVMLAEILANNAESAMNQLQTEQKLREQEQRLKRTTEFLEQTASVARLGGWEADPRTEALEWTDEVYRIHGFEVGETPSLQEAFSVYHPEDRDRVEAAWDALSSDGEPFDIQARLIRADEVTRWVRIVGIPEYDDEGERVVRAHGIFQDITDQNEREQTLRQYRQAIEASEDLIITVGTDGRYVFANSTYKEYYSCEDVVDRPVSEIIGKETFEQTVQQHQQTALAGDSVTYERTEELPALGQRTLSVRYAPIRDDEDVLGFVGILRDITEKKAYERQLETQRNNLEILNTIVRHDIRNDIQLIQTYAGILETRAADDTQEYVDEILEAAQSAIEITQSAREITDVMLQSDVELSAMNLRTELDEEIQRLQSSYERAIVDVKGPLDAVEVVADEMLPSVFRNILNNAVQHNDKDIPEITVSTNLTDTTAVVHIADNGPGIPDDQKAAVFEEEHIGLNSNGTGLGLYLVETLVSRYGGQVHVLDNEPEGAIFVLQLPRAES